MASTSDVYGNAPPPFGEDDHLTLGPPTTRRWAYAVSKLYDEHVALAMRRGARAQRHDPAPVRLLRAAQPPELVGRPAGRLHRALLDGKIMDIHGDGRQIRTFTYVQDTVDGFVRAIDTPEAQGEIINIGGDEPTTILRLAQEVQTALGISGPLRASVRPLRGDRRPVPGRPLPDP